MNLLKNFPEIDLFFRESQFDDEQLSNLFQMITEKYQDNSTRKSAISLIKLELLKYKIEDSIPKTISIKKKVDFNFDDEYLNLKKKNILEMSIALNWTLKIVLNLLKKNGLEKQKDDFLSIDEFRLIKEDVFQRFKQVKRIEKLEKISKRPIGKMNYYGKSISNGGVYDKISENGGIGKLIYIRKKS